MTVTADINARTGFKFSATLVTAAIAAAGNEVGAFVDDTWVEDGSELLDAVVTQMAVRILVEGKNIRNLGANTSEYNPRSLYTSEMLKILATYKETNQTYYVDISPDPRTGDTTTAWRE